MRDRADRPGGLARTKARNAREIDLRTRRDEHVVVWDLPLLRPDEPALEVKCRYPRLDKLDALLLVDRAHVERDVLLVAETERHPDERWDEDEFVRVGDDRDVMVIANQCL